MVDRLDAAVDEAMASILALSSLTSPLALDYLDRLARPIPALTPEIGVQIVTRAYVAHLVVERDPAAFGAVDVPVLGTLPPLRRGSPPRDLLTRVVKASRRNFEVIRAVSTPVWNGFVRSLTRRAHDQVPDQARPGWSPWRSSTDWPGSAGFCARSTCTTGSSPSGASGAPPTARSPKSGAHAAPW